MGAMPSPDQLFARLGARQPGLRRALPLALLLPPFAFALAEPARALAAMFLMLGLAVWTVMGQARPGWLILVTTLAYLVAAAFPYCFSPLAYVVGVACFVLAEEGAARG
jgi:hypothetical protein